MSAIHYSPDYCPPAPYIYYHMLDDGYIIGGEFKDLTTAFNAKMKIIKQYGPDKTFEVMGWE